MKKEEKEHSLARKILNPFIAGSMALLPLAVTIVIIIWLTNLLQGALGPESGFGRLLESVGLQFVTNPFVAYFIGLLAAVVLLYLFGLLVQAGLRNRWNNLTDVILTRIPLVKTIYDAARKLVSMLDAKDQPELKAMIPVMCYFGGKGGTAVLALLTSKEKIFINGHYYYSVLIPSSPVPIGGAILYLPVDWVETLDIGIDGIFNVYMSMGVTSPDLLRNKEEKKEG